jgi:uncharacterized protein YjiS (DUF1127 family)
MLRKFLNALERRKKINQTIKELSVMSDRELADIGIHRGMIMSVALECAIEKEEKQEVEANTLVNYNLKGWA